MSQNNSPKPTVTITDPERRQEFLDVIGTDTVQVLNDTPELVDFPGESDIEVYLIDLDTFSPQQIDNVVLFLSDRHKLPPSQIAVELNKNGLSVRASNVQVNAGEEKA